MNDLKRHRVLWKILYTVIRPYLILKFSYTHDKASRKEPCLIISNHVSNWDPLLLAMSFKDQHISFVASEHLFRMGWLSKLIQWLVALIPRRKGSTGMDTAMTCLRQLRAGQSVCIFGSGETTWDGLTVPVLPATAMLAQISGATLITYRIEGGYLTNPRWGKGLRRGKMHGGVVGVYTAEQLKGMKKDEILSIINSDINEDTWANQTANPIAYKGKNRAQYMESALFLCPECKQVGTLKGKGDHIHCQCGLDLRFTETGFFEPAEPFRTIADWDAWQLECFRTGDYALPEEGIADDDVAYIKVADDHHTQQLAEGKLTLKDGYLHIGEHRFALTDISNMAIVRTNRLIFSMNGEYYELKSQVRGCCMRKYLLAWQNAKAAEAEKKTREG